MSSTKREYTSKTFVVLLTLVLSILFMIFDTNPIEAILEELWGQALFYTIWPIFISFVISLFFLSLYRRIKDKKVDSIK
ncbi:hypothetical protein FITA111629_09810 [Filibacter tadaridae]|uniref:Uncharacterized protein n=1 Tax=Filibacter tadaridae TaxID=2483811 RepID=A0A3P5XSM3_9BACL|nr:hypothetical protein FILTAD_02563 [Filibacter tadaridae]